MYIDDILVTGKTDTEHLGNLDLVLKSVEETGLHIKGKVPSPPKSSGPLHLPWEWPKRP